MTATRDKRARCAQCGRELRSVRFNLKHVVCKDCYGLDRYRRTDRPLVERQMESATANEEETP